MKILYSLFFAILFSWGCNQVAEATPYPAHVSKKLASLFKSQDSLNKVYIAQGKAQLCEYLLMYDIEQEQKVLLTTPDTWIKQIGTRPLIKNAGQIKELSDMLKKFNNESGYKVKLYNLLLVNTYTSDNSLSKSKMESLHFTEVFDNTGKGKKLFDYIEDPEQMHGEISDNIDKLVTQTFNELKQAGLENILCYSYTLSIGLEQLKADQTGTYSPKYVYLAFEHQYYLKGPGVSQEVDRAIISYKAMEIELPTYESSFENIGQNLDLLMRMLKYAFTDRSILAPHPNHILKLNTSIQNNRPFVTTNQAKALDEVIVENGNDYIDISPFLETDRCKPFTEQELNEKINYLSLSGYEFYTIVDYIGIELTQEDNDKRAEDFLKASLLSSSPKAILLLATAYNQGGQPKTGSWRVSLAGGQGVPFLEAIKSKVQEPNPKAPQLEDLGARIYYVYAQLPKRQIVYAYGLTFRDMIGSPLGAYYLWEKKISIEPEKNQFGCGNAIQIAVFQTKDNRPVDIHDFNKRLVFKAKNGASLEVKEKYIKNTQETRPYVMELTKKALGKTIINTFNEFCQDYSTYFPDSYKQGNADPTPMRDFLDGVVEFGAPFLSLLGPEGMAASWLFGSVYYGVQQRWKEASLNFLFSLAPDLLMVAVPHVIQKANLYILQNSADTYITKLASHTWDDLPASAQIFKQNINPQNYQYTVFKEGQAEHIVLYNQAGEALIAEIQGVGKYKVLKYEQSNDLKNLYAQPATNPEKAGALLEYLKNSQVVLQKVSVSDIKYSDFIVKTNLPTVTGFANGWTQGIPMWRYEDGFVKIMESYTNKDLDKFTKLTSYDIALGVGRQGSNIKYLLNWANKIGKIKKKEITCFSFEGFKNKGFCCANLKNQVEIDVFYEILQSIINCRRKGGKIHFNLDNLPNITPEIINKPNLPPHLEEVFWTTLELSNIVRNKDWFDNTTFYKTIDGKVTEIEPEKLGSYGIIFTPIN